MALKGSSNAEKIWNFLLDKLNNPYGVAGLMGNLYAESGLNPKNLQQAYNNKLGMTDEEYTQAVDNGSYSNFVKDSAGYGLAQWTYSSRKLNLFNHVKTKKTSIGDLEAQLEFLYKELTAYTGVIKILETATTIKEASDVVLIKYERPVDQSEKVKQSRAASGQKYFDAYYTKNTFTPEVPAQKEETKMNIKDYDKYVNSTGTHYLSNSGGDENNKLNSGKAGDQTGKEWQLRAWYNRPWTHVFRYEKDARVPETLVCLGCAAALNDKIGYDQWQRTTYWTQLKEVGYDPSKITTPCEEDCSAGVAANVKAAGYILDIPALQGVSYNMTSRNTVANLTKAGFTVLKDKKYLTSGDYLLPGDILLYENHHVSMNITKGKKVNAEEKPQVVLPAGSVIGVAIAKGHMNIRAAASTSAKAYTSVKKGTSVNVLEIVNGYWYKIEWPEAPNGYAYTSNNGNRYYEYIPNAKVEQLYKTNIAPDKINNALKGDYSITAGSLHVRKGPGTSYESMTILNKGAKVQCMEGGYTEVNGTKWLKITFMRQGIQWIGYSSSRYLKKV